MRIASLQASEGVACLVAALVLAGVSVGASAVNSVAINASDGHMANRGFPLEVTLKTDKDSYKQGDVLTIQILLTNKSETPIYIYAQLDWGESASLSIWIKDAVSGKDIPQQFIADALTPPPTSKDAFVRLLPDHVYGVVFKTSLGDLNVKKSGAYELMAEYHSPIRSEMSFGLPIWSREKGTITSNRVKMTVRE
jgi:hypothetical protein